MTTNLAPAADGMLTWTFDIDGIAQMYASYEATDLWPLVSAAARFPPRPSPPVPLLFVSRRSCGPLRPAPCGSQLACRALPGVTNMH